ncbi:MAG: RHS domain-containing protein [Rhodospirillales bacterium]|nr:RHS domain-containing protein [Rhodospirillales bacterium]
MITVPDEQLAALARNYSFERIRESLGAAGYTVSGSPYAGRVLVTDRNGNTSCLGLDGHGRLALFSTPLSQTYAWEYDEHNRVTSFRLPFGHELRFSYDERDRPSSCWCDGERRWRFEWDDNARLLSCVYPDNCIERSTHHPSGGLADFVDRAGGRTVFERDERGTVVALVDPNGRRTTYEYAGWDRPARIVRPDGSTEEVERDKRGRVRTARINGALWAHVEYDDRDQISRIDYGDGHFVAFTYDAAGRVTEARNPSTVVRREYDAKGRLLAEDQGDDRVTYTYDDCGLLTQIATPDGASVGFHYDADGRVVQIDDLAAQTHTFAYRPSENGQRVRHRYPNGIVAETALRPDGRPLKKTAAFAGASPWSHAVRFTYDVNNRLTDVDDTAVGAKCYEYDAIGQVTGFSFGGRSRQFAYDANGNRLLADGEQARFGAMNELFEQGGQSFTYDARGNLTEAAGDGGRTRYTFNDQNLLIAVDLPDSRRVEFTYDAFARRIHKRVGDTTTRYLWAGEVLLAEITEGPAGRVRRDYLFFPGVYAPLSMRENGCSFFFHNDPLGAPQFVSDASGHLVWFGEATPFGMPMYCRGSLRQPLRFPGHYFDEETGLHYGRARYYSPHIGRWLSRDPLDLFSGPNLYLYCGNDPVNDADPLGLLSGFWKYAAAAAIVAVGVAAVVVAGPAVLAVAAGAAAFSAATVSSAALVVAGGAAIGAGVGLGLARDGCIQCQAAAMKQGALIGAGAALGVMGAAVGAIGAAGGGGLALAGAGATASSQAAVVAATNAATAAAGMTAAATGVAMMQQGGQGEGGGEAESGEDETETTKQEPPRLREPGEGTNVDADWGNPKSTKAYGHSRSEHGAQRPGQQLADRARGKGTDQGQFHDNDSIVEAEQRAPITAGEHTVEMGKPVGRVYHPDGSTSENVTKVKVIRKPDGSVRTSYPVE